jgi:hypothetical protein
MPTRTLPPSVERESSNRPSQQTRTPAKATILCLDPPFLEIPCQFNPAQISFSKSAEWTAGGEGGQPKRNVPVTHFKGGGPSTLSMDLFFDTTAFDHKDVRDFTEPLSRLTLINPLARVLPTNLDRPTLVKFVWGEFSSRQMMAFTAYIKDVSINFTMFLPDGTPVRADTKITFTSFQDDLDLPLQNPTSRSEERKMHVVSAGETIDWIAFQEYGDPAEWRHIARTNNLLNAKDLAPGMVLKITPLPLRGERR